MHMKIKTLRRALTELEDDIGRGRSRVSNQLNKVSMSTADAALEEGTSIVENSVSRISLMIDMKFAIRGIISDFNESKGINIKTIEIAKLSLQNDFLEKVIIDRIQPPSTHYSYRERDPIQWKGGIEEDTNEKYRQTHRENKRKIQSLKDGCASINSSTVELTPELVTFLTDFKFV